MHEYVLNFMVGYYGKKFNMWAINNQEKWLRRNITLDLFMSIDFNGININNETGL